MKTNKHILLLSLLLLLGQYFISSEVLGQSEGDFRTKSNPAGFSSWTNNSTWEKYDGSNWIIGGHNFDFNTTPTDVGWTLNGFTYDASDGTTTNVISNNVAGGRIRMAGSTAANDWAYIQIELTEGVAYSISAAYRTQSGTSTYHRLHFAIGTTVPSGAHGSYGTSLYNSNVASTSWTTMTGTSTFTPPSTGTYYLGVYVGNSLMDHYVDVDNIQLLASGTQRPSSSDDVNITIRNSHYVILHNVNYSNSSNIITVQEGGVLETTGSTEGASFNFNSLNVYGTFIRSALYMVPSSGTIHSTGNYRHNINAGAIPALTWEEGSTLEITGVTSTVPTATAAYQNVVWNTNNQSANLILEGNFNSINGNFRLVNTSTHVLVLGNTTTGRTMTIGGDFIIEGGSFAVQGAGAASNHIVNVNGNYTQSGGTFSFVRTVGEATNATLELEGNFTMSGGTIQNSPNDNPFGTIKFKKTGEQIFSKTGGEFSQLVHFEVLENSILNLGTSIIDGSSGTFTLESGAGLITAHEEGISSSGATGSVQVTGTRTYNSGANYTYNGSVAQVTGNGLPSTVNNFTINNSHEDGVTLTNNLTIAGVLALTSGTLDPDDKTLLVSNTAEGAVIGGSSTSFVSGPLSRTLPASASSGNYAFPVGKGGTYYPFGISDITTGADAPVITVQAFNENAGGTAGAGIFGISNTEYWEASFTGNYVNGKISLGKPDLLGKRSIARSATKGGEYLSLNGTVSGNSIINSDETGSNLGFFVMETLPITVHGANSISDGTGYATLKEAFDAINTSGSQSGRDIEVRIHGSVTDNNRARLNEGNWNSLTVYPTADNVVLSGGSDNNTWAIISLFGANNVTIDGRVNRGGETPSLTILNTGTVGGHVSVEFLNSAQYNTVKYCNIQGQLNDNSRGVVFFGSSSSGDGNSYNIIRNNKISGISDDQRPRNAIASNGTNGRDNQYNQIINNEIFNWLNPSESSNGIVMINASDYFTIKGNSFYENESMVPEDDGFYFYYAIRTNTNSVHYIEDNFIGGNSANANGTWSTKNTTVPFRFTGIYVAGKEDEASIVQNNTIRGFDIETGGFSSNHDTWDGIFIQAGNVDVLNNTIGSPTGTGSIKVTASPPAGNDRIATAHGFLNNSSGVVNIRHNTVGSIEIIGTDDYSHSFEGIYLRGGAGITYITDNLFGSETTEKSIHVSGTAHNSDFKQDNYGIYSASQNETHIKRNIVANLHNAYTGSISSSRTRGIRVIRGANYIEDNKIYNISSASEQPNWINSSPSVIGIEVTANDAGTEQTVIGNTVYKLSNTSEEDVGVGVWGIYFWGPNHTENKNIIERNFIHSLSAKSTSNNTILIGLLLHRGDNRSFNNVISLGEDVDRGYRIYGIWDNGGSNNNNELFFNTVRIGGDVTEGSGTSVSTALWNQNNGTLRDYRNNIFANKRRLNGEGNNNLYAVRIGGRTNLTMDYNNYWSFGNRLGRNGNRPLRPNLSSWRAETQGDQNSLEINPEFQNESGEWDVAQDFLTNDDLTLQGIEITVVIDDYDRVSRLDPPKIGAFENNRYVWYGTVSTDFNDPGNWAESGEGIVPPNGADVRFAEEPDNKCFLDQERTLRNIIISSTNANNNFVLNGNTLNLRGVLDFENDAELDATEVGSMLVLKGFAEQTLPVGSITSNTFAGLTLDNELGFTQEEDFTVTESFVLTDGEYLIGENTLTINGSVAQTEGILTGGSTSDIVFGGSGDATILPGVELNDLTINRAAGINLAGNVEVMGDLILDNGTLRLADNVLKISGDIANQDGNIDASDNSAELIFANDDAITLVEDIFVDNEVNDLTISGTGGVTSQGDFTVNGVLNLQAANPSDTKGSLDMFNEGDAVDERKVLTMGANATTIGVGDVTGKVKRNTIAANTVYTFGSEFSTIEFTGGTGAELPSDLTFIIKIGEEHPITNYDIVEDVNFVKRYYEIIRSGGSSPTRFNLTLRYLPSELNGNDQTKMVFWDHHVRYSTENTPHEHGVSFHNTDDNYMVLASHGIGYLVKNEYDIDDDDKLGGTNEVDNEHSKIWLFADRVSASGPNIFVWIGLGGNAAENSWDEDNNWADNCSPKNAAENNCGYEDAIPYENQRIFIQAAPFIPTEDVPENLVVRSLYIEQGGEFDALAANISSITVHGALDINNGFVSWSNQGTFNAGTSTVTFKSENAVIAGDTDFNNLVIDDNAKLSMIAGTRIGIANDFTLNGTGKLNTTFYGSSTVEYNGAAQTVIVPENNEYSNLILSGSGTKTMPATALNIKEDFEISGTAQATAAEGLTIDRDMRVGNDATFTTGEFNHSLKGNLENNGTFTATSGSTFTFNGSSTQIISGDSKSDFHTLELNNSEGLNLFSDVDIASVLNLNSGTIDVGANTLGINGTISGVSETNKINVTNQSSLSFGGSGEIELADDTFTDNPNIQNLEIDRDGGLVLSNQDFTVNGELKLTQGNLQVKNTTLGINGTITGSSKIELESGSSLSFGGSEAHTISDVLFTGTTIENLTINSSNTITLGYSPFNIKGTLNLQAGSFNIEGKTLNISGNLTGNVGTLATDASTELKFFENDISDPAISLPGSVFSNNILGTLHIDRTNGFNLSNQDIIIDDDLILEKGIINGNSNLIIFNAGSSFTTDPDTENLPADATRYINGCVRKIGNTAFTFPIGDFEEFAPIGISDADGTGEVADYFTACYYSYDPTLDLYNSNSTDETLDHASLSEYWTLDRNEDGTNQVQVTLSWDERSGPVTSLESLRVARWDAVESKWVDEGNESTSTDPVEDLSNGTITSDLVEDFSPFTLASTDKENPLPISLLYFNAECNNSDIQLVWKTATEINNEYFEILRSKDASSWESIAIVSGAGNSNFPISYIYLDKVEDAQYYYKLLQYDFDGTKTEFQVVYANCREQYNDLSLFPNPAGEEINLIYDDELENEIFIIKNSSGQTVKTGQLSNNHKIINIRELSSGMYILLVPSSGQTIRFQKY